jgi:glycosyltransferase involved in cell wall biosynthesis
MQKISIITVSYNSKSTIERTIRSVLGQKNVCVEYIIVDGFSSDGTVDIIREYANKHDLIKWISEKDGGIYDAMNKGIRMATGDIVGILNSDDFYASDHVLQSVVRNLSGEGSDSCYGDLLYIKSEKPYRYWKSGQARSLVTGWMPPHPAFFLKKSVYDKYGLYRLDCGTAADYELMVRMLQKNGISTRWIHEVFVVMTAGGASNQGLNSRMKANDNDKKAWVVNDLRPSAFTLILKKTSKIPQFIFAKVFSSRYSQMLKGFPENCDIK